MVKMVSKHLISMASSLYNGCSLMVFSRTRPHYTMVVLCVDDVLDPPARVAFNSKNSAGITGITGDYFEFKDMPEIKGIVPIYFAVEI